MSNYDRDASIELKISDTLADDAAQMFVDAAKDKTRFFVSLSGGSTPSALFERLATHYATTVDWSRIHFFWGDERSVPPTHADSNYGVAKAKLLDPVGVPPENIHRFEGERPPDEAAAKYAKEVRRVFGLKPGAFPRFDLVFLGLGDDGHTASLFPGSVALGNLKEIAVANFVPKLSTSRLTLTYPAINAASCIAVLVSGKSKAQIVHDVLKSPATPAKFPMQGVKATRGRLLWFADTEAASLLTAT